MNNKSIFYIGVIGVGLFVLASILGTVLLKDYNPVSQFISESYARDAPFGFAIRLFGFIPSGILLTLFCFLSFARFPENKTIQYGFISLGLFYGVGTIMTGIFPYDSYAGKELVKDASISQHIHNLSGFLTYIFSPLCILSIGTGLRKATTATKLANFSILSSILLMFLIFVLFSGLFVDVSGLLQRIIETIFLLWFIICSVAIKNQKG